MNTSTNLLVYSQKQFIPTFTPNKDSFTPADFAAKLDFATQTKPGYIALGDLDGDGKVDMAVTNELDNTVSLFLNTSTSGSLTYAARIDLTTGAQPEGVAIGDIDGDGKLDIAVTNFNANSVSIYRNTSTVGSLNFAVKVDYALGSCPFFVVIRDINGDGRADLVTANKDANTISVVLNTGVVGTISFATAIDLSTGAGSKPYAVTVGDLDGDGKPDIAAAGYGTNVISVFRSIGTIGSASFATKQDFPVTTPYSISIGDLDGDGLLDLATANFMNNTISVFKNTSTSGTINFAAKADLSLASQTYSVAIGDINGDGKPDLVVPNYSNDNVSIFSNTSSAGSIAFATREEVATGVGPDYVAIGDMDGDGKSDLVVANYTANTVSVLRNKLIAISTSGTLAALSTTYNAGASATSTSFTVSANNLLTGITITPPTGFELSQTAGGTSGYAGKGTAITVGAAGTVATTTIYVRLAAGNTGGTYSGNIVCTSTSANTVNVATVDSKVNGLPINITANNATKSYGAALVSSSGVTTFTAGGLVNGDKIESVTLIYASGAGNGNTANDAVGTYTGKVVPSAATGGTFINTNYAITYISGDIIVTKAPLTITAANKERFAGIANPSFTASYSGFITGEDANVLTTQPTLSTLATISSPAGTYAITASGAVGQNYSISYLAGTLTITGGAPSTINLAQVTLYENQPSGTAAGILSSTSNDLSSTFTYTLVAGAGDTDNGSFTITGNQLQTAASLNYEAKAQYQIRVQSTTSSGFSLAQSFTVNLSDVNEVPTLNFIADQRIYFQQNNIKNIPIQNVTAGPETSQSIQTSITTDNPGLFQSLGVSNNQLSYVIKDGQTGTATLTVTVKDNGGTANGGVDQTSQSLSLTVDAAPIITGTGNQTGTNIATAYSSNPEISKGLSSNLRVEAADVKSISWSGTGLSSTTISNPVASPTQTTTYYVTVTNSKNFSTIIPITVSVKDDYVIQADNNFSPNGDGINDNWKAKNIENYPNHELKIFDRSGKILYQVRNYQNDWNGTLDGLPLSSGTYYYLFKFDNSKIAPITGFITIVL